MEFIFRFIVGGLIVSLFAVLGDVLKPRSFAGLFAAAPSGHSWAHHPNRGKIVCGRRVSFDDRRGYCPFFICFHRYPAHHEIQFAHRFGINQRHPGVAALRIGHVVLDAAIDTNERPS
jgi:hypothetical protein